MYLIELVVNLFSKKKKSESFDPLNNEQIDDFSDCEHVFLPVDSTGEILACSKCGLLVNRADLKDVNIFKK